MRAGRDEMSALPDQGIPAQEDAPKAFGRAGLDEQYDARGTRPDTARERGDLSFRELDERIAHHHEIGARQTIKRRAEDPSG